MIHYFFGPNTYTARQAIADIAQQAQAHIVWLEPADLDAQSLSARLGQGASNLFGRQLLVVRDPSRLPRVTQEAISRLAPARPARPLILWDRGLPDKRSALWRALRPYARECSWLPQPALADWLAGEAKARSVVLEPAAGALLLTRLGADQWRLASELAKLSLLGSPITAAQVEAAVPVGTVETEVFALLDAVAGRQISLAGQQLARLLEAGENELYILSMLAYQFRTLFLIQSGQAGQAGLHPYVVGKHAANAKRFSAAQLHDALAKILATDFAIKQGKIDPRTGLTMLTLGLVRQAA